METEPVTGSGDDAPIVGRQAPSEQVELPDGRRLVVRSAGPTDIDALTALYRRLTPDDLRLRFFTAAAPSRTFLERWVTVADRGGVLLVALVEERSGRQTLVAEAGFSLLADGDAELGITVDPLWRGWLGPWLLAVLLREAADRGVPNLQALVQLSNRPMLTLLREHGAAVMEEESFDEIRLVIGTAGVTPSWPGDHERPRILVEAGAGHWPGETAARAGGFDVLTCRGPGEHGHCPLLEGRGCPLVDGADVVVVQFPPAAAIARQLTAAHEADPDVELLIPAFGAPGPDGCETATEVVARLRKTLGLE